MHHSGRLCNRAASHIVHVGSAKCQMPSSSDVSIWKCPGYLCPDFGLSNGIWFRFLNGIGDSLQLHGSMARCFPPDCRDAGTRKLGCWLGRHHMTLRLCACAISTVFLAFTTLLTTIAKHVCIKTTKQQLGLEDGDQIVSSSTYPSHFCGTRNFPSTHRTLSEWY